MKKREQTTTEGVAVRRGRPRKFATASRAVTLTLPEDIIEALGAVDRDLGRAIVRVTQPEMAKRPRPPAELATFGRRAVIVVNPTPTLAKRVNIGLVPLPDGRALISLDESMTAARLELSIQDALADSQLPPADALIFKAIEEILKNARRSGSVAILHRNIMVLESNRSTRRRGRKPIDLCVFAATVALAGCNEKQTTLAPEPSRFTVPTLSVPADRTQRDGLRPTLTSEERDVRSPHGIVLLRIPSLR